MQQKDKGVIILMPNVKKKCFWGRRGFKNILMFKNYNTNGRI